MAAACGFARPVLIRSDPARAQRNVMCQARGRRYGLRHARLCDQRCVRVQLGRSCGGSRSTPRDLDRSLPADGTPVVSGHRARYHQGGIPKFFTHRQARNSVSASLGVITRTAHILHTYFEDALLHHFSRKYVSTRLFRAIYLCIIRLRNQTIICLWILTFQAKAFLEKLVHSAALKRACG